jgi:hypothetical protein
MLENQETTHLSDTKIMQMLHVGGHHFREVRDHFKATGEVLMSQMGRPKKFGEGLKDKIDCQTMMNPGMSGRRMAAESKTLFGQSVSRATIDSIRKELHFRFLPKISRQILTSVQIQQRLQFAQSLKNGENGFKFGKMMLVFSDESRFCLGSDSNWVWRRLGEDVEEIYHDTVKFPKGIMVWGAIGHGFKSKLEFIDGTLNSDRYCSMVKDNGFVEECNALYGGHDNWMFVQDGATCHTAKPSLSLLFTLMLILLGWPANSPDLNPIEMIWGVMKRRLNDVKASTIEDFRRIVQEVWDTLDIERVINPLVDSFERRIDLVIRLGGVSIQRHLHQSMDRIGVNAYGPVAKPPPLITTEQDDEISRLVQEHGHRWKLIGEMMGIDEKMMKSRALIMEQREQGIRLWNEAVVKVLAAEQDLPAEERALMPVVPVSIDNIPAANENDVVEGPDGPVARAPPRRERKGRKPSRDVRATTVVLERPGKDWIMTPCEGGGIIFNGVKYTGEEVKRRLEMTIT